MAVEDEQSKHPAHLSGSALARLPCTWAPCLRRCDSQTTAFEALAPPAALPGRLSTSSSAQEPA